MSDIKWTLSTVDVATLTDYFKNPRSLSKEQFAQLKTSLDKFGMIDKPIINADSAHTVIGGHQRLHVLRAKGVKRVEVWLPDRELTAREVEELNIRLNKNTGSWDMDTLANSWEVPDLLEWGFAEFELGLIGDIPTLEELEAEHGEPQERDFWPYVRVQVSPETMTKFKALMVTLPGADEAEKFDALVSGGC